jgi:hypothetical protein
MEANSGQLHAPKLQICRLFGFGAALITTSKMSNAAQEIAHLQLKF